MINFLLFQSATVHWLDPEYSIALAKIEIHTDTPKSYFHHLTIIFYRASHNLFLKRLDKWPQEAYLRAKCSTGNHTTIRRTVH